MVGASCVLEEGVKEGSIVLVVPCHPREDKVEFHHASSEISQTQQVLPPPLAQLVLPAACSIF